VAAFVASQTRDGPQQDAAASGESVGLSRIKEQADEQIGSVSRRVADPMARREWPAPLPDKAFGDLFDYWVEHRGPQTRTAVDQKLIIRRYLRPAFGRLKVAALTAEHIHPYINARLRDLEKKTIANHLTLLVAMMNVADRQPAAAPRPRSQPAEISPGAHGTPC
jgi:hypothetical protein